MPKLLALSDLHVGYPENRRALADLSPRRDDWLILCGDVADTPEQLVTAFELLQPKFARLLWVPGNHELWSLPRPGALRGVARYEQLVALCRAHGVATPEDPYLVWEDERGPRWLILLFLLYDHSFRPDHVPVADAVAWAREHRLRCSDERLLHADPFAGVGEWCASRCEESARRIEKALAERPLPTVLVNHFPLKQELAVLPRIPRFMVWCGTRRTEQWHLRYGAEVVVSGHLHIPGTRRIDGVRFEEVSLGYPSEWERRMERRRWSLDDHLCQILPAPERDRGHPLEGRGSPAPRL